MSRAWAASAIKIVPKGSLLMSLFVTFSIKKRPPERDGSQVAFSLFFCGFLEGPTLDPLAPAQSKHSLPFSVWPLKGSRFYCSFSCICCTVGVGISLKGTSKLNLKKNEKVFPFCIFCSFGHPFGHLMGRLFLPLGRGCPQKGKVFSSLGPWNFKRWCLTLSGATGASDISCFLESGA